MLHANCKTLGHVEEIWVIHYRDIVKIKRSLIDGASSGFFFSCLHWFFIAGGPGWPTGPIRRLLLFWEANIILGKLKIKLISDTKLHSSALGLPVQARRPLTCASPTPKQFWIFYLAAVFSGFADVVLGAARPSALPPFHVRRQGWGRGLGWKRVSVTLMTTPASTQATPADVNGGLQLSLRSTAALIWARGKDDDLSWRSVGSPWQHNTKGHWTQFDTVS